MDDDGTALWTGASSRSYTYLVYALVEGLDLDIERGPGNFIFARMNELAEWVAVFIGQTSDLGGRVNDQRTQVCAIEKGSTHVHVRSNPHSGHARLKEVADLVEAYEPPCNQW